MDLSALIGGTSGTVVGSSSASASEPGFPVYGQIKFSGYTFDTIVLSSKDTTDFGLGNFTVATAPEPSTWAMMLAGFAGLGFAGYRARRTLAVAL